MRANSDFSRGKRGAIARVPKGKTRITIRIDDDVLDWFRAQVDEAGGGNYQTLINDALRAVMTEEVTLIHNPKFWAMIEQSRKSDKTLTVAEVRTRIAARAAAEAPARPPKAKRAVPARRRLPTSSRSR